jgi:hypothetical protein
MQLDPEEALLFEAACSDTGNAFAQELLNVFGVERATDLLAQVDLAPIGVYVDLLGHVEYAVFHEARRRDEYGGERLEDSAG